MSFFEKVEQILSTVQGWILTLSCVVVNFFGNYEMAFIGVIICIIIDMFVGIWCAIKQNKYARSELMRDTFSKILIYCGCLVVVIFIEKLLSMNTTIICNVCAALICATELWSITANALIINPNLHFFKIIRLALVGEIARKLNITENEVKDIFKEEEKKVKE
jgi:hypothetical protein